MSSFFSIIYIPFGLALDFCYKLVHDYGIALLLFTIFVRLIILPASISQQKGMGKQARFQPKISKIQKKFAGNQVKINEEMQNLYKREGYNPARAGCVPMAIQLPVLWGLYGAIYYPLTYVLRIPKGDVTTLTNLAKQLYPALAKTKSKAIEIDILNHKDVILAKASHISSQVIDTVRNFDFSVMGLSLTTTPSIKHFDINWVIPILATATAFLTSIYQYFIQKQTNPEISKNPSMGCMTFSMPLITLWFTFTLPAGVSFYWFCSNVIAFIQMVLLYYIYSPRKVVAKDMILNTIERRSKEEHKIKNRLAESNGEEQ